MKYKKTLQIIIILSLIGILIYVFVGLKKKQETDYTAELIVDGERMVHSTYDKQHRKAMELKCSEAERESDDKTVMKNIEGVIYKKGRLDKDVQVHGKSGYVANNAHNFYVEGDARVFSEDFDLKSLNFLLEDQSEMSTEKKVHYEAKDLKGVAARGMRFYLNLNVLKLFKTRGHYKRDNRDFDFKTDVLWVIDKDNMVVLEKNNVIREANSILRSGWVSLTFTKDFKRILEAASQVNSYFYMEDKEKKETREIKSENITSYYNDSGKMTKVTVIKNGEILLKSETDHTMIMSDLIEIYLNEDTGKIMRVSIPSPGRIENTGKNDLRVTADQMNADYNEAGELAYCEGRGNTHFTIDEYQGIAETLLYDIEKNDIALTGQNAQIINKGNTFNSTQFSVDTEEKILSSIRGVKSVILLNKKNVLFSNAPIFINAKEFKIFEKQNKFRYDTWVQLLQEDISMRAESLEISDENKIEAYGKVFLSFKNKSNDNNEKAEVKGNEKDNKDKEDKNDIAIRAEIMVFNAKEKNIDIIGSPVIRSNENVLKANHFVIQFDDKNQVANIFGEEEVSFNQEDLSGTSERVKWLFNENTMVLQGSPSVTKRDGGTTVGKELKIDLETNNITILSSGTERSETIIK